MHVVDTCIHRACTSDHVWRVTGVVVWCRMNTYTLLALVALCGMALAKYEAPCCSVEDRKEVQRLWNLVWTESRTRRLVIAEATLTE